MGELLLTMLIIFSTETLCQATEGCGDNCYMWGYTTWHCDCWIYNDGSYGKDRHRAPSRTGSIILEAPTEQKMESIEEVSRADPVADVSDLGRESDRTRFDSATESV